MAVIQKHLPSNLFVRESWECAIPVLVKHMNFKGEFEKEGIHYYFNKRSNHFLQVPFITHSFVVKQNPHLILVQGFIFPVQVIALRKKLGKKPVLLLQHHGELPCGRKQWFQRLADPYIDGYLLASKGNADPWVEKKIIASKEKCFEMPSSSTLFSRQNKEESKARTGMNDRINFFWVGRLDSNKDPMTVLEAFEKYFEKNGEGVLWMAYSESQLEVVVRQKLENSGLLRNRVKLLGRLDHEQLQYWYSAADYFILASRHEGGSYALTEAMACGCIPIISNIPPSMKSIDNGKCGYYFEAGNAEKLNELLSRLDHKKISHMSGLVLDQFHRSGSPRAIADTFFEIYQRVKRKN
jgi:glycosyltransferase involved in cell wall biosynthesis